MSFDRHSNLLIHSADDIQKSEILRGMIAEAKTAFVRMPEGKRGLVIGSGPNTPQWQRRGWATLDMDPTVDPDFLVNANWLEAFVEPNTFDFVLAERLTFDRTGVRGVRPKRLAASARAILKDGGVLVVQTARHEETPLSKKKPTIPLADDVMKNLKDRGFHVTAEYGPRHEHPADADGAPYNEQETMIYVTKAPHSRSG